MASVVSGVATTACTNAGWGVASACQGFGVIGFGDLVLSRPRFCCPPPKRGVVIGVEEVASRGEVVAGTIS